MSRYTLELPPEVELSPTPAEKQRQGRYSLELPDEPASLSMRERLTAAGAEALRQVGLTGRYAVEGVTALPNMVGDALGLQSSQTVSDALTRLGLPRPETPTERVVGDASRAVAGATGGVGFGQALTRFGGPVAAGVGEMLSAAPATQGVVSGAASGAAGGVREAGGGPGAQLATALGVSVLPVLPAVAGAAMRGAVRGGETGRQQMANRIAEVRGAGAEPSVGMATGNRRMQAIESVIGKAPGGGGPIARSAEQFNQRLGQRVQGIADDLAPGVDATKAGRTIERGIKGLPDVPDSGFVPRFKGEQTFLYNKLDAFISEDTAINVSNARTALQSLTRDIRGAKKLSEVMRNSKVSGIARAFLDDSGASGTLPYQAVKEIRSLVGDAIADGALVADAPIRQLRQIYGALSDDMASAARAAGPQAERAFSRANAYTRAGHERIDGFLERLVDRTADQTFKAFMGGNDPTSIAATLRSLKPAERDIVKSAVVQRMGMAPAGQQDAAGEVFSAATFLTNWNKLNPRAKLMLFAGKDGSLRANLDQVAKAAEYAKKMGGVLPNNSGTGPVGANIAAGASALTAVATGNVGSAAVVVGGVVGMYGSAKVLTHPATVGFLARASTMPAHALPAALNTLAQIADDEKDPELRAEIRRVHEAVRQSLR